MIVEDKNSKQATPSKNKFNQKLKRVLSPLSKASSKMMKKVRKGKESGKDIYPVMMSF